MNVESKKRTADEIENGKLNYLRASRKPVEIVLSTEQTVVGVVTGYTRYTITVSDLSRPRELVLFKASIVSIEIELNHDWWQRSLKPREQKASGE